jgi:hypothetical protein
VTAYANGLWRQYFSYNILGLFDMDESQIAQLTFHFRDFLLSQFVDRETEAHNCMWLFQGYKASMWQKYFIV